MMLLLEHLGRLYTVRQIDSSVQCLVVTLAFPAEICKWTSMDNIWHKLWSCVLVEVVVKLCVTMMEVVMFEFVVTSDD